MGVSWRVFHVEGSFLNAYSVVEIEIRRMREKENREKRLSEMCVNVCIFICYIWLEVCDHIIDRKKIPRLQGQDPSTPLFCHLLIH